MQKPRDERPVKSFGADGIRRRNYSIEQAEALAGRRQVVAQRNRKGAITSIHFYGESGVPLRLRRSQNVRFTESEYLADRQLIKHKPLPYRAVDAATGYLESKETIDLIVRSLFMGVANSCFVACHNS